MRFSIAFLIFASIVTQPGLAGEPMVKVVFRAEGQQIPPDSFAAKAKTLYIWKSTMGRVEEMPDLKNHLQGLIIANGKDIWQINLMDKTGRHIIDPGPTYDFYVPIIPPEKSSTTPPLRDFQIGRELAYMTSQKVVSKLVTKDSKSLILYQCVREGYELSFYVSTSTGAPTESDVYKNGKLISRLVYLEYKSALDPDPSLFQPPPDVTITEAEPPKH